MMAMQAGHHVLDVPSQVAAAAREAYLCHNVRANRGAVVLARSVVQAVAKDKGVLDGNLLSKIDTLHRNGHLRGYTHAAANEVRLLANDMAHGDFAVEVQQEDAADVLRLMHEVLEEVYVGPGRLNRMQTSRACRKTTPSEDPARPRSGRA